MRAFLTGGTLTAATLASQPERYGITPEWLTGAAVAEARRILGEVEPEGAGYYIPGDGYRYLGDCWVSSPVDGNAHAAVAEALAAKLDAGAFDDPGQVVGVETDGALIVEFPA